MPYLNVENEHEIYFQVKGKITQQPTCLFLHGGPGAGFCQSDVELFDKTERAAVFFDQRGCGKSRYKNPILHNTTQNLITDIEKLRKLLNVEQWILVGGSWGSTLSLAYAIEYPERVAKMILWGVFLCSKAELHWFYYHGANFLFPETYEKFSGYAGNSIDLISAYHQLTTQGTFQQRKEAASQWARWEAINSFIQATPDILNKFCDPKVCLPMAVLETYYFMNDGFFPYDDYILKNIEKIADIPVDIVQGRYDSICPFRFAWLLCQSLKFSQIHESSLAAHDVSEKQNNKMIKKLLAKID